MEPAILTMEPTATVTVGVGRSVPEEHDSKYVYPVVVSAYKPYWPHVEVDGAAGGATSDGDEPAVSCAVETVKWCVVQPPTSNAEQLITAATTTPGKRRLTSFRRPARGNGSTTRELHHTYPVRVHKRSTKLNRRVVGRRRPYGRLVPMRVPFPVADRLSVKAGHPGPPRSRRVPSTFR
jgi:hypothetical protein